MAASAIGTIAVTGRLERVPRARLARELQRVGGSLSRLVRWRGIDGLVFGHGAYVMLDDGRMHELIRRAREHQVWCMSEDALMRAVRLAYKAADEVTRDYFVSDVARHGQLEDWQVEALSLLDVLDGENLLFDFRSLSAARQV